MRFIDAHDFLVGLVLRVPQIVASTYYDWRARATLPASRRREDTEFLMIDEIRASHEFAGTYGSGWNFVAAGSESVANASSGSCGRTGVATEEHLCFDPFHVMP
ncbi:hypothetical protein RW1_041_00370 [Rhodococcus wratislaviensis NBRC 100605]|uniref:Uncharacterized protein n=1 Tax=Rhodococcus wratislaviensis NBRC 100605 TaxID=1219028 RepID=X0Q7U2_RHOWR|nr:hypothetical protein [Rhodococcus wratislaviensis]GAF47492.1 hypothetical protein RW1_041_00370 [Rhodococcus wratislaviensis NBRC 100605]